MTANPIDLIGGLATTGNVVKADISSWAKARVPQVLANPTELRNTTLVGQLVVTFKSTGGFWFQDTTDTTTADDGINCIVSADGFRYKPIGLGNLHLVVYTVAPSGASASDKLRADFVAGSTNAQVAILAAITAAGASNSSVIILPGAYTFSATLSIPAATNCTIMAEGATITGPGGTLDTIFIASMIRCNYYWGTINHTGTGSALHVVELAQGSWLTWQELAGTQTPYTTHNGNGFYLDATTKGSSTSFIRAGWFHGFSKGIYFESYTIIDTHVIWANFGWDCTNVIYDHTAAGATGQTNSCTWNVNIDSQWVGAGAAFWTNGANHIINATIGTSAGGFGPHIQLDKVGSYAATSNILTLTPPLLAQVSGNVVDNSLVTTNTANVGMPIALLATTDARGSIVIWDGGNRGQFAYSGLKFGGPIGAVNTLPWFSATGIMSSLATVNNGILVTSGAGVPSLVTTLPSAVMPALTGDVTTTVGGVATTLGNAPVIAKVLTGYVKGAGAVSSTDSILAALQKIDGNDALKATAASPTFTGTITASGPFGSWTTYAPTFTASNAGAAPTVTVNSARFWTIGKTTFIAVRFTITNINANTGQNVVMSLPNTAAGEVALPFFESGVSGNIGIAIPNGSTAVTLNFYANSLPVTTNTLNYVHHVCGSYENT